MNDIYINLIIIVIIIVLFLAYILIAHFYNNYINYKNNVNDNFNKTKDYINTTTTSLNKSIKTNTNNIDDVDLKLTTKINNISNDVINTNNNITSISSNVSSLTNSNINNNNNITNLDRSLKQFFEFRSNNSNINDALYNYRFDVVPNLSMNLLRNVTAVSGITIKTDTTNIMRICDNNINNSNCIDMNINNGTFDIYPSAVPNNNIDNINIYNKNKQKVLARFDLNSNNIYLGGNNEEAGIYINDSNVYLKNVNFLTNNAKFNDNKQIYDKNNQDLNQIYNTYKYNIDDIIKLNNISQLITGIYTIIKSTGTNPNTIIINFKSAYDIPINKSMNIDIYELANTDNTNIEIINSDITSSLLIQKGILNEKKIILKTIGIIRANTNVRVKLTDIKLALPTIYDSENYISNIISTNIY